MTPNFANNLNSSYYRGIQTRNDSMNHVTRENTSVRLTGMFMTISLAIFALLFLYVLFNMAGRVDHVTIVMLFFIAFIFFVVLMKTCTLLNSLTVVPPNNLNYDTSVVISTVSTVSGLVSENAIRRENSLPTYDEAMRNSPKVPSNSDLTTPPSQDNVASTTPIDSRYSFPVVTSSS